MLACGAGAVLSHAAAAAHWGLRPSSATLIDVTVTGGRRARRPGIRVHRRASLDAREATIDGGVPVTTPARTLLDLGATLPRRSVERALDQGEVLRLFDLDALHAVAAERDRARDARLAAAGVRTLRFTARQIEQRPLEVLAALRGAR